LGWLQRRIFCSDVGSLPPLKSSGQVCSAPTDDRVSPVYLFRGACDGGGAHTQRSSSYPSSSSPPTHPPWRRTYQPASSCSISVSAYDGVGTPTAAAPADATGYVAASLTDQIGLFCRGGQSTSPHPSCCKVVWALHAGRARPRLVAVGLAKAELT
jgi:hypothetical protein